MSSECGYCERDSRGPHDEDCPRHPDNIKQPSGGSNSYYMVDVTKPTTLPSGYRAECNDIIEALGLNFAEGNILKALWRIAAKRQGRQNKTSARYDAEKIEFFARRVVEQNKEV